MRSRQGPQAQDILRQAHVRVLVDSVMGIFGPCRLADRRNDLDLVHLAQPARTEARRAIRPQPGATRRADQGLYRRRVQSLWPCAGQQRAATARARRSLRDDQPDAGAVDVPQSVAHAERVMQATVLSYPMPNKTLSELHVSAQTGGTGIDPLAEFSTVARQELAVFGFASEPRAKRGARPP